MRRARRRTTLSSEPSSPAKAVRALAVRLDTSILILSFLAATSRGSRAACGREHRKRNGAIEKEVPNVDAAFGLLWRGIGMVL
jgi:hypothetical protein